MALFCTNAALSLTFFVIERLQGCLLYRAELWVCYYYSKLCAIFLFRFGTIDLVILPLSTELFASLLSDHETLPALGVLEVILLAAFQIS